MATATTFNRSNITKTAWTLVKTQGLSFSQAMKQAWEDAKAPKVEKSKALELVHEMTAIKFFNNKKSWNGQFYGFSIYLNNIKIDIAPAVEELRQKGLEGQALNYIKSQFEAMYSKALDFENELFETYENDEERNEKVREYIYTLTF